MGRHLSQTPRDKREALGGDLGGFFAFGRARNKCEGRQAVLDASALKEATVADKPTETTEESAEEVEEEVEAPEGDEFDKERAMKTIHRLRDIEKEHKALLAEKDAAAAAEAEAQKTLEERLAERETRIEELLSEKAEASVKADFVKQATKRGIQDPELAYLAAKAQGALGDADPKTGEVGNHDFEAIEERFPGLAGESQQAGRGGSGDAGVRGKRGKKGVNAVFNESVRGAIGGFG